MKITKVKQNGRTNLLKTIYLNTPEILIDLVGVVAVIGFIVVIISLVGGIN